jgi:probable HAF family extracellular repeat protein
MKLQSLALSLGVAALLCVSTAFAQTYTFQTINYPGDTFTQLLGINNRNVIAGYHGASVNQGFTYALKTNTFTTENYPGSAQTQVIGIANTTNTAGFYISSGGATVGFIDRQGTFASVAYPNQPFNQLLSQNDVAQAAGYYSTVADGSGPDTPYVYDELGGVFEALVIPNSFSAQATGINNSGNICGFYVNAGGLNRGWLLVGGHFTVLNYPGSTGTQALGLNNQGSVVGFYTDSSGNSHGFVYSVSTKSFQSIDDPDGVGTTIVNGINDNGVLVGFFGTAPVNSGFVASPAP